MAFTRDFTGAPEGALKINGPIQVAIVDETTNSGSKNYVPAFGEIVLHKTSSGQFLKVGDGTTKTENIPGTLTTQNGLENYTGIDCGELDFDHSTTPNELIKRFQNNNKLHINGPFQILTAYQATCGKNYVPALGELVNFSGCDEGDDGEYDLLLGDGRQTLGQIHATGGILKRPFTT